MSGLIGKKIGMTSVYSAEGKNIPCTVIEAGPCVVTQIKTVEKDGYAAVQLAYDEKSEKQTSKCLAGHFAKAGTTPKRKVAEFRDFPEVNLGDTITVDTIASQVWVARRTASTTVSVSRVRSVHLRIRRGYSRASDFPDRQAARRLRCLT